MELVAGSKELDKTRFQEALLEQELGGLKYNRQIRLGGSLTNPCIPTDYLVDRLPLGGRERGFSSSSSISSSITHHHVILCLYSSSLLFYLSFYCCVLMFIGQSSLFVYPLAFTLFRTQNKVSVKSIEPQFLTLGLNRFCVFTHFRAFNPAVTGFCQVQKILRKF